MDCYYPKSQSPREWIVLGGGAWLARKSMRCTKNISKDPLGIEHVTFRTAALLLSLDKRLGAKWPHR